MQNEQKIGKQAKFKLKRGFNSLKHKKKMLAPKNNTELLKEARATLKSPNERKIAKQNKFRLKKGLDSRLKEARAVLKSPTNGIPLEIRIKMQNERDIAKQTKLKLKRRLDPLKFKKKIQVEVPIEIPTKMQNERKIAKQTKLRLKKGLASQKHKKKMLAPKSNSELLKKIRAALKNVKVEVALEIPKSESAEHSEEVQQ